MAITRLICKPLEHKLEKGYGKYGKPYLCIKQTATDGIGRVHAYLTGTCSRCYQEFHVANIHLPRGYNEKT